MVLAVLALTTTGISAMDVIGYVLRRCSLEALEKWPVPMTNGCCGARNIHSVGTKGGGNYSCIIHTPEDFHNLQKLSYLQKYINSERRLFGIATYSLTFFYSTPYAASEETRSLTDQWYWIYQKFYFSMIGILTLISRPCMSIS